MLVARREGFAPASVMASGALRTAGVRRTKAAEGSFDQITLSGSRPASPTFRELAASLSQQVRTFNTTGKIQELRGQVASGEYRPDARETAARMLLMAEGE